MVRRTVGWLALVVALGVPAVTLRADTLVLRNGTRLSGRLLGVRAGVVEFEEDRRGRPRTVRFEVDEVRAVEFDRLEGRFDDRDLDRDRDRESPVGLGRPRGLREREIRVSARAGWTDTGIDVRDGQRIYVEASGRVRWGPGRQDGPEGEDNSPRNVNRPIPNRPGAALIGRIGNDAPFFIGADQDAIRLRGSGTLSLGVNDDVLDDNTGEFRVTVYF
jgi:hypothetical protein